MDKNDNLASIEGIDSEIKKAEKKQRAYNILTLICLGVATSSIAFPILMCIFPSLSSMLLMFFMLSSVLGLIGVGASMSIRRYYERLVRELTEDKIGLKAELGNVATQEDSSTKVVTKAKTTEATKENKAKRARKSKKIVSKSTEANIATSDEINVD